MAGAPGFEPGKCRSQSPVPYRLATPQYINGGPYENRTRIFASTVRYADLYTNEPLAGGEELESPTWIIRDF